MTAEPRPPAPERAPAALATAVLAAVDAALTAAVPLAVLAVVALGVWATSGRGDGAAWLRGAADLWLAGHGVVLLVAKPAFTVSVAPLAVALATAAGGLRGARRLRRTGAPRFGAAVSLLVLVALGAGTAALAASPAVAPVVWQAALLPPAWYAAGLVAGSGAIGRVLARPVAGAALRVGGGTAALLLATGALALAVALAAHLPDVVGIAEQLHAGSTGGLALTVAQLALVPTLVVWAAAWFAGPGFALGAGTGVSPLALHLGPLPAVPVLGALPHGAGGAALVALVVPVAGAFACGALTRRRSALPPRAAIPVGVLGGVVAGAALGLLALAASGSAGPGRLATVGPDPWLTAVAVAVETAVAAALGFATVRPVAAPLPPEHELPAAWQRIGVGG